MVAIGEQRPGLLGANGSLKKAILLPAGVALTSLVWGAFPAMLDWRHFSEDFKHSSTIPIALILTVFLLTLTVGGREINLRTKDGRSPWLFYWGLLGSLFLMGMLTILFFVGRAERIDANLRAHGVSTQARIVREFIGDCSKHGCSTELEYSFTPRGASKPASGFADEGDVRHHHRDEYEYAISRNTLPIVYDPTDPSVSKSNWNNRILNPSSSNWAQTLIELLAGLLFIVVAIIGVALRPTKPGLQSPSAAAH
jgi:hypothetical protein